MAVESNIIELVRKFVEVLDNSQLKIEEAYLFGSYANGNQNEYSDIDLALVSEKFSGIRFFDNETIIDHTSPAFANIQTHPFLPDDFIRSNPFVKEILKTGIKIP